MLEAVRRNIIALPTPWAIEPEPARSCGGSEAKYRAARGRHRQGRVGRRGLTGEIADLEGVVGRIEREIKSATGVRAKGEADPVRVSASTLLLLQRLATDVLFLRLLSAGRARR